jgi:acyl-CoA reductase-like NAD-dependent aldehyde dehydrogenase
MTNARMWIGGRWVDAESAKTFAATNPATEEEVARVPQAGGPDMDRAIEAARKAFPVWSRKTQSERSACLRRLSGTLKRHAEELARLETTHRGTPIRKSLLGVRAAADSLLETSQEAIPSMEGAFAPWPNMPFYLRRKALGICAVMAPRNVPFSMVLRGLGAALVVGNACIVKCPGADSLSALRLGEMLEDLDITPGAVNIVTGTEDELDSALAARRDINVISFTGTRRTAAAIHSSIPRSDVRLVLQIEDVPSFVILDDADLDAALALAVSGPYNNSFMFWGSPGRYYVHRGVYEEFTRRFVSAAEAMVVGDPLKEETDIGPVVDAEHLTRIEDFIDAETKEGARLLLGGGRPTSPRLRRGYFVEPTVFSDEASRMRFTGDEVFGPLACFSAFSTDADLMRISRDDNVGISLSVWTREAGRAAQLRDMLQTDLVWANGRLLPPRGQGPLSPERSHQDREGRTSSMGLSARKGGPATARRGRLPGNRQWQTGALLEQYTALSAVSRDMTADLAKRLPINDN